MEDMETVCFQIISNAGTARSLLIEAIREARDNFEKVDDMFKEANQYFSEAHKIHGQLIQKEAKGESVPFSLLFMHAEDQLMSTETIKHLTTELVQIYKKLND